MKLDSNKILIAKSAKKHSLRLKNKEMKLDLNKILVATVFVREIAEKLEYDHSDTLDQLLDEVDTLAVNSLDYVEDDE